jgi:hypothetical protein
MRFALTASEQLLWSRISARQLGVVFRRQVPLCGRFIADFCAPAVRLVVEVDGVYHAERLRRDAPGCRARARGVSRPEGLTPSLCSATWRPQCGAFVLRYELAGETAQRLRSTSNSYGKRCAAAVTLSVRYTTTTVTITRTALC